MCSPLPSGLPKIGLVHDQTSPRNRPIAITTDTIPAPANDDAAAPPPRRNEIHRITQGKTAAGKTLIARLHAACLRDHVSSRSCVDADPGTPRFSRNAGDAARCPGVGTCGYADLATLRHQLAESPAPAP